MSKINVYKTEAADNLAEIIQKNNSIAYCVEAKLDGSKNVSDKALSKLQAYADEHHYDLDLIYVTKSVLASTTWNKNDDIFGGLQTWEARKTPIHTYTDIGHEHREIVGCVTDTWVIDAEGNLIGDDTEIADLPSKFHLCNSAVIWKHFKHEDMVTRAETLIQEIEDGKKFVSMECVFSDFDYGVISPENKYYVVARNDETSFLTKHLRIYGGQGSYNGYKIGRFLKNMVFSGKGYVDKPANPESIIFNSENELIFSESSYRENWFNTNPKKVENFVMANEIDTEKETLRAQVVELNKKLAEADVKSVQADLVELRAELAQVNEANATLATEKKTLEAKIAETNASTKTLNDKIAELAAANDELNKKVAEAAEAKVNADRVSMLVEGGLSKEDAQSKVTKYISFNDEQFADVAEVFIAAAKDKAEKDKEKPADKKEDKKDVKADEIDTVLDTAKPKEDAAGSVDDNTNDNTAQAEKVRQSLASYFGSTMTPSTVNSGDK